MTYVLRSFEPLPRARRVQILWRLILDQVMERLLERKDRP